MKKIKLYISIFLSLYTTQLIAQDNVLYQFNEQAQSIKLNPANQPKCRLFIGIPVLSNLRISYDNSAFSYKDLFIHSGDSLQFNLAAFQQKSASANHIRLGLATDILSIAYAYKDIYFMFNIDHQTTANISFPGSLFDLTKGNWNVQTQTPINYNFNSLGVYVQSYNNFSLSISKPFNKNLRLGVRLSYLKGLTNLSTFSRHLGLETSSFPIALTVLVNSQINSAGFIKVGLPAQVGQSPSFGIEAGAISVKSLIFPPNTGFSVDFGLIYHYTEVLTISSSLRDLGYIKWKTNATNVNVEGSYAFKGVDLDSYLSGNSANGNIVQTLKDSILNSFTYTPGNTSYSDALPMQFMFAANYEISEKTSLNALVHSIIYDQVIEASVTAGIIYQLGKAFKTNLSLSYLNNTVNVGGGFVWGKKHLHFFLITENIPLRFARITGTPIFIPYSARTINLQTGLSLSFGCDRKSKKGRVLDNMSCPAYPRHRNIKKRHKKIFRR